MNEVRTYASLSSGLLARKGAAKPAMRPQAVSSFEDLGWNDLGESAPDAPEHVPSSIAALTPAPRAVGEEGVFAQQRAIAETFTAEPDEATAEPHDVPAGPGEAAFEEPALPRAEVVRLPRPRARVGAAGRKTAFTLRLDTDRHLRLRLACAVEGRSAQQLVTAALDRALADIPEIQALAGKVSVAAKGA